jgi:hypothetical protein
MAPFRLQYASNLFVDLHKQKYDALAKPVCSTLALLGNIGRPDHPKTYHFLNFCARNWDSVLWCSGSHELTTPGKKLSYTKSLDAMKAFSEQFPNVRCMDSEEEVVHSNNVVILGLPPRVQTMPSVLEKTYRANVTQTVLKTVFFTMTNPLGNFIFLSNKSSEKIRIPIEGSRLETPVSLWLVGDSPKNTLSIDLRGKQFFATNSLFVDSSLLKRAGYSSTAFVEIGDSRPRVSLQIEKQSLQLA